MTAGPGLTNTVTAVKNAQMAESPLLLMGGAAATLLQVRNERIVASQSAVSEGALLSIQPSSILRLSWLSG